MISIKAIANVCLFVGFGNEQVSDFKVCLGIDFKTYQRFVNSAYACYARYKPYNVLSDEQFSELLENNEWLDNLNSYMADYQLPCGDLKRLSNIGMVMRDGEPQIVILDSGLSDFVWNEYYKKK